MVEITRRTLIGGAAAAGVGVLTAGVLEGAAEAATAQGSLPTTVDVVVARSRAAAAPCWSSRRGTASVGGSSTTGSAPVR